MLREKEEILNHHMEAIQFVDSLRTLTEDQWRRPIQKGKWSISEIIGHFIPWDQFVLQKRIPYLFTNEELSGSPNAEKINQVAAAKSRYSEQNTTITEFIETRQKLLNALRNLDDDLWLQEFSIGTKQVTLYEYFYRLVQHDRHHFEQIRMKYKQHACHLQQKTQSSV